MGLTSLWAVHLPDSILQPSWHAGGFVVAGLLMLVGAWRLREEDIPPTALLAAAFFVASLIHVPVGPSSAHLLLNGLVGVVLGRRAALAIPTALLMQALLLHHGGLAALGVNSCVMTLPALAAGCLFRLVHRVRLSAPLLAATALLAAVGVVAGIQVLAASLSGTRGIDPQATAEVLCHPLTLAGLAAVFVLALVAGRRWPLAPELALGLFLGQFAVLLTLVLHALVLVLGGSESYTAPAAVLFLVHLPVAVVEGAVLGSTVGFLMSVKPSMLGLTAPEVTPCSPDSAS